MDIDEDMSHFKKVTADLGAEVKAEEVKILAIWKHYELWFAVAATAIVCLLVGYHLHK